MKYLLDSNIVSEPIKSKPHPAVVAWLDLHESECAVSTITLAELRYGIERLPEGKRRRQLEREFAFFRQDLGSRVVAFEGGNGVRSVLLTIAAAGPRQRR